MATQSKRLIVSLTTILTLALAFLFGGAGMTVYAAQSALPGDTLYQVKTTVEQTRISLAGDAAARAQLHLEFAERRLVEISGLIAEGRFTDISTATREFESYVESAIRELETVAQGDPQRAAVLTAQIMEALSRYNHALGSMVASVPDPVKVDVLRAIQTSDVQGRPAVQTAESEFSGFVTSITPGLWIIGGQAVTIHSGTEVKDAVQVGDFVKVHASLNSDGDLVAREIELSAAASGADDNGNTNSNSNANDDSLNGNANDDNGNDDSLNGNANDDNGNDDSINGNANDDNGNDDSLNGNANDDNGNESIGDDSGGNGNDDSSNTNGVGDDSSGSNTNGDDSSGSNTNGDDSGGSNNKGGDDNSGKGGDDNSNGG